MADGLVYDRKILVAAGDQNLLQQVYYMVNINGSPNPVHWSETDRIERETRHFFEASSRADVHKEKLRKTYATGQDFIDWMQKEMKKKDKDGNATVRTFGGYISLGGLLLFKQIFLSIPLFGLIQFFSTLCYLYIPGHTKGNMRKVGKHGWAFLVSLSATSDLLEKATFIVYEPNDSEKCYGINRTDQTINNLITLPRVVGDVSDMISPNFNKVIQRFSL